MKRAPLLAALIATLLAPTARAQSPSATEIAVVVHVSTSPLIGSDGSPAFDRDRRLQALASALDALAAPDLARLPLALAPSAVTCDEAMRLKGATPRRFLRSLRRIAEHATVLLPPFANVRLPDLNDAAIPRELADGRSTVERCTGVVPSNVLYPPGLAVDDASVKTAKTVGATATLTTAVDEPVTTQMTLLPTITLPPDASPAALLARAPSRSFVVVGDVATSMAPQLHALATEPAVALRTVDQIRATATTIGDLSLPDVPAPPAAYRRALLRADESYARFGAVTLHDNPVAPFYRDVLARARSTADMASDYTPGRKLAERLVRVIDGQLRKISVGGGTITFTSRRGSVPVTVINHATYPVRVRVAVSSPKLSFPDGETQLVTVDPPGAPVTFNAVARSTGSFPMLVSVRSPDDTFVVGGGELTVRSTAANLPALAVTIGGVVLFIYLYARRKRRHAP